MKWTIEMSSLTMFFYRNVIPYNAFLLKTLNCHLSVDYCSSIKSIQYLFKYQYKGNGQATMQIIQEEQNHDEVQHFLNTRYVSSMEATWRILTLTCVVRPSKCTSTNITFATRTECDFLPWNGFCNVCSIKE